MSEGRFSPPGESSALPKLFADIPDVIDRLPPAAADRLRRLRAAADDARALTAAPYEAMKAANQQRTALAARIDELVNKRRLRDDDPLLISERETLARLTDRARALTDEASVRRERAAHLGHFVRRAEDYISSIPRSRAIELAPALPAPKVTKPVAEEVDRIRDRIDSHRRAIRDAANAPILASEAKRRAASLVTAIAANGAPDVVGLLEGGSIEFPMKTASPLVVGGQAAGITESRRDVDTLALFCWLHRDQLIASIAAEIDANADDGEALSDADRAAKITKAKAALLADERLEALLIEIAESQGANILPRSDVDCRAFLGLSDALPEPRDA